MVLCCWAKGYQELLYLVSNLATAEEACRLYQKRFRIETFFSDQKSRGFHIISRIYHSIASLMVINRGVFSIHLGYLFRHIM